jgi:hypothetical protein
MYHKVSYVYALQTSLRSQFQMDSKRHLHRLIVNVGGSQCTKKLLTSYGMTLGTLYRVAHYQKEEKQLKADGYTPKKTQKTALLSDINLALWCAATLRSKVLIMMCTFSYITVNHVQNTFLTWQFTIFVTLYSFFQLFLDMFLPNFNELIFLQNNWTKPTTPSNVNISLYDRPMVSCYPCGVPGGAILLRLIMTRVALRFLMITRSTRGCQIIARVSESRCGRSGLLSLSPLSAT